MAESNNEMNGNRNGLHSLAKYTKMPIERITYFADADAQIIGSIERGVLFLMAFWSGPSIQGFAKLKEVIGRLDEGAALKLVVADVDGSPLLYEVPEFLGKVHGAAETAWIRHGKIVATSGLGFHPECFELNTEALLAMD